MRRKVSRHFKEHQQHKCGQYIIAGSGAYQVKETILLIRKGLMILLLHFTEKFKAPHKPPHKAPQTHHPTFSFLKPLDSFSLFSILQSLRKKESFLTKADPSACALILLIVLSSLGL